MSAALRNISPAIVSVGRSNLEITPKRILDLLPKDLTKTAHTTRGPIDVRFATSESDLLPAYALLEEDGKRRGGFPTDLYPDFDAFKQFAAHNSSFCVLFEDRVNDKLTGFCLTFPSPLSRGAYPTLCECTLNVAQDYAGLFSFQANHCYNLARFLGYSAFATRVLSTNVSSMQPLLKRQRGVLSASIPYGVRLPDKGWVDDTVVHVPLKYTGELIANHDQKFQEYRMPIRHPEHERCSMKPLNRLFSDGTMATITEATQDDLHSIENLMLVQANRGNAFGLDEFDEHGTFNYSMFRKYNVLVAKTETGSLIGGIVFGLTKLTKMHVPGHGMMHMYIVMNEAHTGKGYATELGKTFIEFIRTRDDVIGIMSDVYIYNVAGLALCKKLNFLSTGLVQNNGTLKGKGFVDSVLFYYPFKQNSKGDVMSQMAAL